MDNRFISNVSVSRKRKWLIAKGYESAKTADNDYINKLFDLYKPALTSAAKKQKNKLKSSQGKEWKSWEGTNRPSHLGGPRDRRRNFM
jgi:hypothetical protein